MSRGGALWALLALLTLRSAMLGVAAPNAHPELMLPQGAGIGRDFRQETERPPQQRSLPAIASERGPGEQQLPPVGGALRGLLQSDYQAQQQAGQELEQEYIRQQQQQQRRPEDQPLQEQQQQSADQAQHVALPLPQAQQQAQAQQPKLLTFENDPVPEQVPITDWQGYNAPEELTSSSFLTENATVPNYVAMCLVIRDQHADIVEWVHHHLRLGISKVYVFDNGSDPPLRQVLQKYIDAGVVVYHHFTAFEHPTDRPQLYVYDRCLQDYGHRHTWMVFIDSDEFLIFRDGPPIQSLPNMLKEYVGYSGLAVHWILFGSSGHISRPWTGVLPNFYKSLPLMHSQHTLVKTIANTKCTASAWGPHAFHHNCSAPVVRTDFSTIEGPRADTPVFSRLVVHHYATKSLDEFKVKTERGSGMRRKRGMEYFWYVDAWSVEFNFDAVRVWDDLTSFQHYPSIQTLQGRYDNLPVHAWNA